MIHEVRVRQRGRIKSVFSMPFIYSMIIPIVFIDIWARVFQAVCFPIYGMEMVERKKYTRYDRHKLPYLDWFDKLHCDYCMYANGTINFVRDVLKQTEMYWCPIRNKIGGNFKAPEHHKDFVAYNDKAGLKKMIETKNIPR